MLISRLLCAVAVLFGCSTSPGVAGTWLLVANKGDASLSALRTADGRIEREWSSANGPHEVAVSPDGRYAVVAEYGDAGEAGGSLLGIDFAEGFSRRRIHLDGHLRPHGLAWFDDSRRLAVTAETSRKLLLVDVATGTLETAIDTGQALSHMVALDAVRGRAYVSSIADGDVAVIDLEGQRTLRHIATGAGAEGIAVHPNGEVWVCNRQAGTLSVIDPAALSVVRTLAAGRFPIRVAMTGDGRSALVSDAEGGAVLVFDTRGKTQIGSIDLRGHYRLATGRLWGGRFGRNPFPIGLVAAPDDPETAYVSAIDAGLVLKLDLSRMVVSAGWEAGAQPDGLAIVDLDMALFPGEPE